jgi:hypothetical protein
MRWDQCCESDGCTKPAHHGALCAACYRAASPARRAVERLAAPAAAAPAVDYVDVVDYVDDAGASWLQELWAA